MGGKLEILTGGGVFECLRVCAHACGLSVGFTVCEVDT